MDYQEYRKLRKQIEDEYTQELASLDKLWKRIQVMNGSTEGANGSGDNGNGSTRNFSKHLRIVVKGFNESFTADDVQQGLIDHGFIEKDKINRLAITNGLHRLMRRNEIQVIQKGTGRTGATYKTIEVKEG